MYSTGILLGTANHSCSNTAVEQHHFNYPNYILNILEAGAVYVGEGGAKSHKIKIRAFFEAPTRFTVQINVRM